MRTTILLVTPLALALVGCAIMKRGEAGSASSPRAQKPVATTPSNALVGQVIGFNPQARFVVLSFPVGRLPAIDQRLNVYRKDLKVGELKVTGPQRDDKIVADVVAGEVAEGDEVRDR